MHKTIVLLLIANLITPIATFTYSKTVTETCQMQWSKTYTRFPNYSVQGYPVSATDKGTCIIQTADGGYAIAGIITDHYTAVRAGGIGISVIENSTGWLIKTNSFGEVKWEKAISIDPISIFQTNDSGFIISGDEQVLKIDANGNTQWNKTFVAPWSSFWEHQTYYSVNSAIQSSDGNFVLAGSIPDYFDDAFVLKIDKGCNLLWNTTFSSDTTWLRAAKVIEVNNDEYAVAGHTNGAWFALLGSDGNLKINRNLGTGFFNSFIQTKDGGFALAGTTNVGGMHGTGQGLLVKVDSKGMLEWNCTYDNSPIAEVIEFLSLAQTGDEGYVLAGGSALLKVDSSGHLQWHVYYGDTYGDPIADSAISVVSTNDYGFVVAGTQNKSIWVEKSTLENSIVLPSYIVLIAIAAISLVAIGVILLIYFQKRRCQTEMNKEKRELCGRHLH